MTTEEEFIEQLMDAYPHLSENIKKTGGLVSVYRSTSQDVVHKYVINQWDGLMNALPVMTSPDQSMAVVKSLGALALTMERVGIPEFEVFQDVAATLLKIRSDIAQKVGLEEQPNIAPPHGTIH